MKIKVLKEYDLGIKLGQCRSCEVDLGYEKGRFFAYSESENVDPYEPYIHVWQNPMHIAMYGGEGQQLWHRELSIGLCPGVWFMPFIAFDLDKDGVDEIWFVNNPSKAPFDPRKMILERINSITGETIATYPFPAENTAWISTCFAYRYMLYAGYVNGEPVIVTHQGCYEEMYMQCYNSDMTLRWSRVIEPSEGARASHTTPILDINCDGIDEVFIGEHIVSLDTGDDILCLDREKFFGHSDVVLPFKDYKTGKEYIFTCRENGNYEGCPRVVMYDYDGNVIWQDVYIYTEPVPEYSGHIHGGFVVNARPDYRRVAVAIHDKGHSYVFDAITGEKTELSFVPERTHRPIDINGDGYHEYVFWEEGRPTTAILDENGKLIYKTGGVLMQIGKLGADFKGEQIICFYPEERKVRIWGDIDAVESDAFKARHNDDFHEFMNKMIGSGYNWLSSIDCEG